MSDQNQPLGVELRGSCEPETGSLPLMFAQRTARCAMPAQYLVTTARGDGGNGFALVGPDAVPLPSASANDIAPTSALVCAATPVTGSYTAGETVSAAPPAPVAG